MTLEDRIIFLENELRVLKALVGNANSQLLYNKSFGGDVTLDGSLLMLERAAPDAPQANQVVIYAVDNGAGKTQLMSRFATGAVQQITIEP